MSNLRLHQWLPPLLVAGVLGVLLYGVLAPSTEARDREIAALRSRAASPSTRAGMKADVDGLLERYGTDPVARWAAIEVHARRLDLRGALAVYDGDPALRDAAGSPRRLARELLRWLGDRAPDGPPTTWLYPRSLLARLDVGDDEAKTDLDELTDNMESSNLVNLYGVAHRSRTRGAETMAASWTRRAEVPEFLGVSEVIHALPGATGVGERLRPLLESDWRAKRPFFWQHVARALGTVGDPASVDALKRELDQALGSTPDEATRRLALDVGLALAKDPAAIERLHQVLGEPKTDWAGVHYAVGLHARHVAGDPTAAAELVALGKRDGLPTTRLQMAVSAVLSDPEPTGLPVDEWLAALAAGPMRIGPTLQHAWALRNGKPGAAAALLDDVRAVLAVKGEPDILRRTQSLDDDDAASLVEALRALSRWAP